MSIMNIVLFLLFNVLYLLFLTHIYTMSRKRNVSMFSYLPEIIRATFFWFTGIFGCLFPEDLPMFFTIIALLFLIEFCIRTNSFRVFGLRLFKVADTIDKLIKGIGIIAVVVIILFVVGINTLIPAINASVTGGENAPSNSSSPGIHKVKPHSVNGYIKSDGTKVDGYWRGGKDGYYRSNPDGILENNLNYDK